MLALTPATVAAGTALADRVGPVPGLSEHAAYGDMFLPWATAMLGVAIAQRLWFRRIDAEAEPRADAPATGHRLVRSAVGVALGIAVVIAAAGTLCTLVLIGHSGARAVWGGLLAA